MDIGINRQKKRVFRSVQRKLESPAKQPERERASNKLLHERVARLEIQLSQLSDAFDQNSSVFVDSLRMTEAMDNVFQRVMNDFFSNGEFTHKNQYMNGPHWAEYVREYWLCMLMADFAAWLKSLAPERESMIITHADVGSIDTVIFGG